MQCLIKGKYLWCSAIRAAGIRKNVLNIFDHQAFNYVCPPLAGFQDDDACQVSLRLPFSGRVIEEDELFTPRMIENVVEALLYMNSLGVIMT